MTNTPDLPAVIFDFGNVLLDWDPRYLYRKLFTEETAMERFLEEIHFHEWNVLQDAGRPFAEAVAVLSAQFPNYAQYIHAYNERYPETISGPIWGTIEILKTLHLSGYPLFGLSNWSVEKFLLMRERYEFFGWFRDIIISGEVRLAKPDPRIFKVALERIGRPAGECLLIDDTPANIQVAGSLGFRTIHFRSPDQLRIDLKDLGLLSPNGTYPTP